MSARSRCHPFAARPALRHVLATLVVAWMMNASVVPAQGKPIDIGTIRSGKRIARTIAVPLFVAQNAGGVPAALFQSTIYSDLTVTGLFKAPRDARAVEAAHGAWLGRRNDFSPWRPVGAELMCSAAYNVGAGGALTADVYVFETTSGAQVFAKRYEGFTAARPTVLAHQIADDILRYIGLEEGISGTMIAFVSSRTGQKEVFAMDASGTNQTQMTNERSLVAAPCWGARGMEIYFTSYRRFNPDLMGITLDRSNVWPISEAAGNNISPSWCERTGRLAVVMGKDGNQELYTVDRTGRGANRLTKSRWIESSPDWSPDGRQIVFVSNQGGGPQIYVMGADGSGAKRVSFDSGYCTSPAWSPDGSRIAYVARVGGRHEIVVLDLRTGRSARLTNGPGNSEDPTWAPNGEYLAYANNRSGKFQVFRMRADGSNQIQVTSAGENTSPAWGPKLY